MSKLGFPSPALVAFSEPVKSTRHVVRQDAERTPVVQQNQVLLPLLTEAAAATAARSRLPGKILVRAQHQAVYWGLPGTCSVGQKGLGFRQFLM